MPKVTRSQGQAVKRFLNAPAFLLTEFLAKRLETGRMQT